METIAVTTLDREVFSESQAAEHLELATSTLHYWLQGLTRGDKVYPPIIRQEPTDSRWVTWAEFIEAGWLSTYRKKQRIPMKELRDFIDRLRESFQVPYPLADQRPLVSGKRLVQKAQQEAGLVADFQLVWETMDGQLLLGTPGSAFVERVVWENKVAAGWRPAGADSPVLMRPDVRFGRPAVSGISTASIYELRLEATEEELADEFEIDVAEVRAALSYELGRKRHHRHQAA